MNIQPFQNCQIEAFLQLAEKGTWVAASWEFEFLLDAFPGGCWCAFDDQGSAGAFVTALLHQQSGWIGNLIVSQEWRGKGIGRMLCLAALRSLQSAGAQTIWLTASAMGKKLYEQTGFVSIDTIMRWSGNGRQRHGTVRPSERPCNLSPAAYDMDRHGWGDRRDILLAATARHGAVFEDPDGFLVLQPCGIGVQLGPFCARDSHAASKLFDQALNEVPRNRKLILDVPAANRSALRMLDRYHLQISGSCELMVSGQRPDYHPESVYALASMGSMG